VALESSRGDRFVIDQRSEIAWCKAAMSILSCRIPISVVRFYSPPWYDESQLCGNEFFFERWRISIEWCQCHQAMAISDFQFPTSTLCLQITNLNCMNVNFDHDIAKLTMWVFETP
jgi:hypothetical protein